MSTAPRRTAPTAQPRGVVVIAETISTAVWEVQGTTVAADTPLMSAGLDSIAATELANVLAERLGTELPQTVLFDHPTIGALASFAATTSPAVSTDGFEGQVRDDETITVGGAVGDARVQHFQASRALATAFLSRRFCGVLSGPCHGLP